MKKSDALSDFVADYLTLLRRPLLCPQVASVLVSDILPPSALGSCALLLSPHPDDECLTGALPLRLKREQGWQIINIAVTLGSRAERRDDRRSELGRACAVLGFDCCEPVVGGFHPVNPATRESSASTWRTMARRLADIIAHYQPQALFMPHARDAHPTHVGTHLLAMDALALSSAAFTCAVFQTEFWHPQAAPNLMVGVGAEDVATLLSALTCHRGEVARNPYDRRFPAYLIDNVRRGSERVGGKGAAAAEIDFAMLYHYGLWRAGAFVPSALNRVMAARDSLGALINL